MMTIPLPSRKQTALLMAGAFVILAITGLTLFLWPARQFGQASHFALLGMNKHGWESIHLGLGLLFIGVGAAHVWWNRKALVAYADSRRDVTASKHLIMTLVLMIAAGFFGAWIS